MMDGNTRLVHRGRWLWCGMLLLFGVVTVPAQDFEWVYRADVYARADGHMPVVAYDQVRNRMIFGAGASDTYYTEDLGETWVPIFDTVLWYHEHNANLAVMKDGRYVWTKWGQETDASVVLVSEDGGVVWKELRPAVSSDGARVKVVAVQPSFLLGEYRSVFQPDSDGLYLLGGSGTTTRTIPVPMGAGLMVPADSLLAYASAPSGTMGPMMLMNLGRDTTGTPSRVPSALQLDSGQLAALESWYRLKDGTDVVLYADEVQDSSPRPRVFGIAGPADSAIVWYGTYQDPETDSTHPLRIRWVYPFEDSLVIAIGEHGELFAVRSGHHGVTPLYHPSTIDSTDHDVLHVGRQGNNVLLSLPLLRSGPEARCRYLFLDTRTLTVTETIGDGPIYRTINPGSIVPTLMPLSERRWVRCMEELPGEALVTQDAGRTWRPLRVPNRTPFAPPRRYGIDQILPMGDGTVGLRSASGRWLVPDGTDYRVARHTPTPVLDEYLWEGAVLAREYRLRYGYPMIVPAPLNRLVTGGDYACRWTADGRFVDTLFARPTNVLRFLSNGVWAAGKDSLWLSSDDGRTWTYAGATLPYKLQPRFDGRSDTLRPGLGDVTNTDDGAMLVGLRGVNKDTTGTGSATWIPGGVFRSTDGGAHWVPVTDGIPDNVSVTSFRHLTSGTLLCLANEVVYNQWAQHLPHLVYRVAKTDVYRSTDHGRSWQLVHGFGETGEPKPTEPCLAVGDGVSYVVVPPYGLFAAVDDGRTWLPLDVPNVRPPRVNDAWPLLDGWTHIATDSGYARIRTDRLTSVREAVSGSSSIRLVVADQGRRLDLTLADEATATLVVVDLQGRVVARATVASGSHPLRDLASGSYVATVVTSRDRLSVPLMIVR